MTGSGDVVPVDDDDAVHYYFPVEVEVRSIEAYADAAGSAAEAIDRVAAGLGDG